MTTPTTQREADERERIIGSIDAIVDSCAIFKRTAEGKAITRLLADLRACTRQAVRDEILDEAAEVCDEIHRRVGGFMREDAPARDCADAIRAIKTTNERGDDYA